MGRLREKSKRFTTKNHMSMHVLIGIIASIIITKAFPLYSYPKILLVCVIGSILPDIDHLLYIFWYKRRGDYARDAKKLLRSLGIRAYINFAKENHKKLTDVYSHNLFTVLFFVILSYLYFSEEHVLGLSLCLSIAFHFVFDLFEDFLFMGKLNSNWILKFNKDKTKGYKSSKED